MIPTKLSAQDVATWPLPPGRLSTQACATDDIELRYYAPRVSDAQVPHARDELYFVVSGHGSFVRGAERVAFEPGDVLFAAAGEVHRFVDFTPDFATWVLFYGPPRPGA